MRDNTVGNTLANSCIRDIIQMVNETRKVGDLEILVLNLGFNNYTFIEFGVDAYYNVWNKGG